MASSRARICSVPPLSEAEQELVGVDPGGKLARLNAAGQRMVHVPEQLVALGDAVIFVDELKALDVHQDHGMRMGRHAGDQLRYASRNAASFMPPVSGSV